MSCHPFCKCGCNDRGKAMQSYRCDVGNHDKSGLDWPCLKCVPIPMPTLSEEMKTFREGASTLLQDDDTATYEPAHTGGVKGKKLARYDLIPVGPLRTLAELYGRGAEKYAPRNWEKGYDWSLSYAAGQRHLNAFWGGEDLDPDDGLPHLAAVVFHAFALMEYGTTHPEFDDRVKVVK